MPGGQMEPWSTLKHSQELKGETVPQGSFFGGLPAKLLHGYPLPSGEYARDAPDRVAEARDSPPSVSMDVRQTLLTRGSTEHASAREVELAPVVRNGAEFSSDGAFVEILTDSEQTVD